MWAPQPRSIKKPATRNTLRQISFFLVVIILYLSSMASWTALRLPITPVHEHLFLLRLRGSVKK